MFFRKTKEKLLNKLDNYLKQVDICFKNFSESMETYFRHNAPREDAFTDLVQETHHSESLADDRRHEFEIMLYKGKKLLPGARSDVFTVLEAFDRLPNKAETILFIIHCEDIRFPKDLETDLRELLEVNLNAFAAAKRTFTDYFEKRTEEKISEDIKEIDACESHSDRCERALIIKLFDRSDLDLAQKRQMKELILNIGGISDRCENFGNMVMMSTVKSII